MASLKARRSIGRVCGEAAVWKDEGHQGTIWKSSALNADQSGVTIVRSALIDLDLIMKFVLSLFIAIHALAAAALGQSYMIDWHSMNSAGVSASGELSLNGGIDQQGPGKMTGEGLTLESGSLIDAGPALKTIFDNTARPFNSLGVLYTPSIWLGARFCSGQESCSLESITLFLTTRSPTDHPTLRLQVFSDDPVTGKPASVLGAGLNLSGATNPVTFVLASSSYETPFKWIPAAPLLLESGRCYWAVLSSEGEVLQPLSTPDFSGGAGFGRVQSSDGGATWGAVDYTSNAKMRIRAASAQPLPVPELAITYVAKVGNELRLSFASSPGNRYAIQARDDLFSGGWMTLPGAPLADAGNTVEVVLPVSADQSRQFYRIAIIP